MPFISHFKIEILIIEWSSNKNVINSLIKIMAFTLFVLKLDKKRNGLW